MEGLINNILLIYVGSFTASVIFVVLISFLIFRNDFKLISVRLALTVFISMMIGVTISIFLEKFSSNYISNNIILQFLWAFFEETVKFLPVYFILLKKKFLKRSEIVSYSIIAALGFAVFENTLFIAQPLFDIVNIYTTALMICTRSVGAMLVHIICSSILVSCIVFAIERKRCFLWGMFGFVLATGFHLLWNLSVVNDNPNTIFSIFLLLWIIFIIYILIIEGIKSILNKIKFNWMLVFKKIGGIIIFFIICFSFIIIIEHFIPKYTQTEIYYWENELNLLESTSMSWKNIIDLKNKEDINKINTMNIDLANNIKSTLNTMLSNGNLSKEQIKFNKSYAQELERIVILENTINNSFFKDYWMKELGGIESIRLSWKSLGGSVYLKNKDNVDNINIIIESIVSDIMLTQKSISNNEKINQDRLVIKHKKLIDELNILAEKVNSNQ